MRQAATTSLSQFLALYRTGQADMFHKRLGGLASEEGLIALSKTLKIVKFFIPEEDIPSYVQFVMQWGRARGYRVDHELLRSLKLVGAFTRRRYHQRVTPAHLDAMRQTAQPRHADYDKELSALVYEARGVFATSRDWSWSFIVAMDRREWKFYSRLEGLVKQFLDGEQAAVAIMLSKGLYDAVQTQH